MTLHHKLSILCSTDRAQACCTRGAVRPADRRSAGQNLSAWRNAKTHGLVVGYMPPTGLPRRSGTPVVGQAVNTEASQIVSFDGSNPSALTIYEKELNKPPGGVTPTRANFRCEPLAPTASKTVDKATLLAGNFPARQPAGMTPAHLRGGHFL
jgi:hypothetical protein